MKKENMDLLTTNLSLLLNRDIQVTVAGIYANVSFIPLVFKLYNMHHVYNNSCHTYSAMFTSIQGVN